MGERAGGNTRKLGNLMEEKQEAGASRVSKRRKERRRNVEEKGEKEIDKDQMERKKESGGGTRLRSQQRETETMSRIANMKDKRKNWGRRTGNTKA